MRFVDPFENINIEKKDVCPNCNSEYQNIGHPLRPGVIIQRLCKCEYYSYSSNGGTITITTITSQKDHVEKKRKPWWKFWN